MKMRIRYNLLLAVVLAGLAKAEADAMQPSCLSKADAAVLRPLAEQGDAVAQYYLSQRYACGEGVERDLVQAYIWSLLAEHGGVSIFSSSERLKVQMNAEQVAEAETKVKAILAKSQAISAEPTEPNEPNQPNQAASLPIESRSLRFQSEQKLFAVDFPSMPKCVFVQDQPRIDAEYYLSQGADGITQYTVSFQTFKNAPPQGDLAQIEFFNDYLNARARVSIDRKLYRKFIRFKGFTAVRFKHSTLSGQNEMTHEGVVFLTPEAAISLICVYPSQMTPAPTFKEFSDSFELIQKKTAQ